MRWEEVGEQLPNEWVICEALQLRSEDGYCYIDEVAVIDRFDDSAVAMNCSKGSRLCRLRSILGSFGSQWENRQDGKGTRSGAFTAS